MEAREGGGKNVHEVEEQLTSARKQLEHLKHEIVFVKQKNDIQMKHLKKKIIHEMKS